MELAHLYWRALEGLDQPFSTIANDTQNCETFRLQLLNSLRVDGIGLVFYILLQEVFLGDAVLEKHQTKCPAPISGVHQDDDGAWFWLFDRDNVTVYPSLDCLERAAIFGR